EGGDRPRQGQEAARQARRAAGERPAAGGGPGHEREKIGVGRRRSDVESSPTADTRRPPSSEMTDFVLRDIHRSDLEALYALDQICFDSGIAYSKTELKQILRSASGCGVLAESKGRVAGFAAGFVSGRGAGHVVTLDVSPEFRRKGLGRALFSDLLE